ncbi:uncharacterized protein LOC116401719 [Cucumis sativus]|uniref:uncharacterized protein LOC116401719 n=1 Tax=Cucumis sativus TaxID=3659 RepID=UPI0012F50460|nr:uncharacterized protein LOC116401719 [Cucumis sativus]
MGFQPRSVSTQKAEVVPTFFLRSTNISLCVDKGQNSCSADLLQRGHRFSRQWLFILEKMEINGSNPHLNGNGNHSSGDSKVALNGKSSKMPTFINHDDSMLPT